MCITAGTTNGQVVSAYLRSLNITYRPLAFETTEAAAEAYLARRCDGFGGFGPALAALRARAAQLGEDHHLLPDRISNEPTSFAMRAGDRALLNVVNYVISLLLKAEETDVNSANVATLPRTATQPFPPIPGITPASARSLRLESSWAYEVIRRVGNYEEIYARGFGENSRYRMDRGANHLWKNGGMLFPLPLM